MRLPQPAPSALRLPRRTLRAQLALLYAAVFGLSCVAVASVAVIFKPNFLVRANCESASSAPGSQHSCSQGTGLSFAGTITHDAKQNVAGLVFLVIMAALAVGIGWLIAGRVLRPLRTITATAREISARNLSQRLAVDGPDDEFRQLGQTLDGLFGRLEASFDAQRHFVANASHELRTPLAAEKTVLQVALADPEANTATLRSDCTTADIARAAVLHHHRDAERRGIRIDAALSAAPATGDPALAESLIMNLVGNAIRHNVEGGWIEISTAITDGRADLTVSNTGPLISPDEVDRLFQPFQRTGIRRTGGAHGHGLGLAIVGAIAGVHGAELTVAARPEGGLLITASFP